MSEQAGSSSSTYGQYWRSCASGFSVQRIQFRDRERDAFLHSFLPSQLLDLARKVDAICSHHLTGHMNLIIKNLHSTSELRKVQEEIRFDGDEEMPHVRRLARIIWIGHAARKCTAR